MRTETIERTIYRFSELSDDAKSNAISRYATDYDWAETSLDTFEEIASLAGMSNPKIYYSGFWSQGDGACVTGYWYASDAKASDEYGEEVAALLAPFVDAPQGLSATLTHRGRYYHEQSVSIDFSWDGEDDYPEEAAEAIDEAFRDLMRWFYHSLEKEYDYLTSVDSFQEQADANEWEFDETGQLA